MIGEVAAPPAVLFAAGIDWLEAILPILFVGFWILSQVVAVIRRVGGGPAKPPVIRVPDIARDNAAGPRPPALPDVDPRAELEKQIADFLRNVTGEPSAAERARPRPQPQQQSPPIRQAQAKPPRPQPVAPPAQPPREASPQSALPPRGLAGDVGRGARHVGTLEAGPSAVARHVQDAFARELGHLHSGLESQAGRAADAEVARPAMSRGISARELAAAARDPATIRQAIVLREILERPVDRW